MKVALKSAGIHIDDGAAQMLNHVNITDDSADVDLVVISGEELKDRVPPGAGGMRFSVYFIATDRYRLQLCSPEVAVALLLQNHPGPRDAVLDIAMEPVKEPFHLPPGNVGPIFTINRTYGNLRLGTDWDGATNRVRDWVFVQPRR
jgi:hypothetical protein